MKRKKAANETENVRVVVRIRPLSDQEHYAGDEEAAPMAAPPAAVIRRAHHDAMGVIQGESR